MQTPDRPERPERPEWLDAWEAIDDDAVTALAYALHGYGVDEVAARDALHALSGEWELVRARTGRASPVEGSGGHEPFQSASILERAQEWLGCWSPDGRCLEHDPPSQQGERPCPEATRLAALLAEARADEVNELAAFLRDDVAGWMMKRAEEVRCG